MRRSRLKKKDYTALSDINIANLVDVVLVLLIIFMISAPLLQSGIEGKNYSTVSEMLIRSGPNYQVVLYWYQNKGRIIASEYWEKIYLVLDARWAITFRLTCDMQCLLTRRSATNMHLPNGPISILSLYSI